MSNFRKKKRLHNVVHQYDVNDTDFIKQYSLNNRTYHSEIDVYAEDRLMISDKKSKLMYCFEVDKNHRNGNEIHMIYQDATIHIFNKDSKKFITALLARDGQLTRYSDIPDWRRKGNSDVKLMFECSHLNYDTSANHIGKDFLFTREEVNDYLDRKNNIIRKVGSRIPVKTRIKEYDRLYGNDNSRQLNNSDSNLNLNVQIHGGEIERG